MRIAVDAMGGDNAPHEIVKGCIDAISKINDIEIELFGPEETVRAELSGASESVMSRITVTDAPDTISMHDAPVEAVRRKKNSSIVMALKAVKEKRCDAFVSAGSTGAVLAGGLFVVGRIKGVKRPALASLLPTSKGFMLLMDCGANMDCKPVNLVQFGLMGSVYMHASMEIDSPRVGLLNVGVEDEKGNEVAKEAFQRLKQQDINFIGNLEARDVAAGIADVCVADGFVGNVLMKSIEGYAKFLMDMLKGVFYSNFITKLGALLVKSKLGGMKKKMNYKEYGGAPLLGVDGVVIKTHGSSDAYSVFCTIKQARAMVKSGVTAQLKKKIEEMQSNDED